MQQASLAEFFQAIISWDGLGVAEKIISFSSNVSPTLDVEAFKRDISTAVNRFSESTPRAGDCMSAIFETVQRYHVTIDPNVMVAVVTVMVLEGGSSDWTPPSTSWITSETCFGRAPGNTSASPWWTSRSGTCGRRSVSPTRSVLIEVDERRRSRRRWSRDTEGVGMCEPLVMLFQDEM